MTEDELARRILNAAFQTHKALGPGLLESIYEQVLAHHLTRQNLPVQRQHPIPISFEGQDIGTAFRAGLLVDDKVIIEVKSVEGLYPIYRKQLLTYLRLSNKRLGILINFNTLLLKDGIRRVANNLPEPPRP